MTDFLDRWYHVEDGATELLSSNQWKSEYIFVWSSLSHVHLIYQGVPFIDGILLIDCIATGVGKRESSWCGQVETSHYLITGYLLPSRHGHCQKVNMSLYLVLSNTCESYHFSLIKSCFCFFPAPCRSPNLFANSSILMYLILQHCRFHKPLTANWFLIYSRLQCNNGPVKSFANAQRYNHKVMFFLS